MRIQAGRESLAQLERMHQDKRRHDMAAAIGRRLTDRQRDLAAVHWEIPTKAAGCIARRVGVQWHDDLVGYCTDEFLKLVARWDGSRSHNGDAGFGAYAMHWTRINAFNRWRRNHARREPPLSLQHEYPGMGTSVMDMADVVMARQEEPRADWSEEVERMLSGLTVNQRLAVVYQAIDGDGLKEAGRRMRRSRERVRQLTRCALDKIRDKLCPPKKKIKLGGTRASQVAA